MSRVPTLDIQIATCSEVFKNELQSIYNGYRKQDKKENVLMDTICFVGEIESESLYSFDFSSYAKSFHKDEMGGEFKVYNNALYDEEYANEYPIFCPNVQKDDCMELLTHCLKMAWRFQI